MNDYVDNEAPLNEEAIDNGAGEVDAIETNEETELDTVEAGQEEVPELDIPDDWEAPVKDFINTGFGDNFEAKKAFHEKYSNFSKDFSSRYKDFDLEKKAFEKERLGFEDNRNLVQGSKALEESCRGVDEVLFNSEIAKTGGTNQYFQGLHTVNSQLSKDPLSVITNLCNAYGVTPQAIESGKNSPEYIARQNQISTDQLMEQKISQAKIEWDQQRENEQIDSLINSFTGTMDESGSAKYPHFEQVRNSMAFSLEQNGVDNPTLKDLDEAYNNACYLDPTLREQLIQSQVNSQVKSQAQQKEVQKAESVMGVKPKVKPISKQNVGWQNVARQLIDSMPDDEE